MLTNEVLERYLRGPKEIELLQEKVDMLRAGREGVTVSYEGGGGGQSVAPDPTGELAARLDGLSLELDARRRQHLSDLGCVVDAILKLDDVLLLKVAWACYIQGWGTARVGREIGYSRAYVGERLNTARKKILHDHTLPYTGCS